MTRNEKLSSIEKNKAIINKMRPIEPEVLKRYLEDSGIVYTHNSTAIEGNTMTLNETWAIIKENATISGKNLAEHLEILGHKEALDFIADTVSNQTTLTESLIKQIHTLVLLDKDRMYRGVYRNVPVRVGSHIPPQPFEVPIKMEQYVADYNQSALSPIEKEAKFHLEFETIHPFIDGNGRTGRLLANFGLMKSGYPIIDIAYSDRRAYYDCFDEYRSENRHEKMYDLFVDKTLESTNNWIKTFSSYIDKKKLKLPPLEIHKTLNAVIHKERPASDAEGLTIEKGEKLYTLRVYDGVSRNCILEGDDGEIVIARNVPNHAGKLIWDKFQSFGKGPDALDRAKADSAFQKNTHDMKME